MTVKFLDQCGIWMERWEDLAPLHNLPKEAFLAYHEQAEEILDVMHDLKGVVFEGPLGHANIRATLRVGLRLRQLGDHPMALRLYRDVGNKSRIAGNRLALAKFLISQGNTLTYMGRPTEALDNYYESIQLFRDQGEEGLVRIPMTLMNAANAEHHVGNFEKAERNYLEVTTLAKFLDPRLFPKFVPNFSTETFKAMILNNMGYMNITKGKQQKDPDKAYLCHKKAASLFQDAINMRPGPEREIRYQVNQAYNMIFLGSLQEADMLLSDLEGLCKTVPKFLPTLTEIHFCQAELAAVRGEWDRARDISHQTLLSSLRTGDILHEHKVVDTYLDLIRQGVTHLKEETSGDATSFLLTGKGATIVEDLITFLEQKDTYTGHNHSKSVAGLSVRLGRKLLEKGLAQEAGPIEPAQGWGNKINLDFLKLAGLLHDLGKLRVPWCLLNKPGRPNPEERKILESHAKGSEDILSYLGLPEVGRVAGEHHETPSGNGYPYGKKDSSLMGACIAVADVFEAATTIKRNYRKPKTKDAVLEEVKTLADIQFDQRVAQALQEVF